MKILLHLFTALLAMFSAAVAAAEEVKTPYWASIRTGEVNMRAGPGEDYKIEWVYHRPQLPMKVLRMMEGWRLVEDPGGARGWMLARFLTRQRSVFVKGQGLADMHEKGASGARLLWRVEPGVVALLDDCEDGWCRVKIAERSGYIRQDRLWGAGEP